MNKSRWFLFLSFLLSVVIVLSPCLGLTLQPAQAKEIGDWRRWNPIIKQGWEVYRHNFIQADDGRVIDHRIGISTSEGQSYAMLRAVWMRDKEWFDKAYAWANDNLKRKDDNLYAWKWGQLPNGGWGIIDQTSASDADEDIALALFMAYEVWKDDQYKYDALAILHDIWNKQTIPSPVGRVMLPGDWKIDSRTVQLNPSYFSPFAYRIFADYDKKHAWEQLIESSYTITTESIKQSPIHLPPDWVELNLADGSVKLYSDPLDNRSDYGYEAIRVFWRFGLDALLNPQRTKDQKKTYAQAQDILRASQFLPRYWKIRGDLPGRLSYDGIERRTQIESAAVYGASLIGLQHQDPDVAIEIIEQRIEPNLKPGGQWNTKNDYYSQNWLWLGLALYASELKNINFPKKLSLLERLSWLMNFELIEDDDSPSN